MIPNAGSGEWVLCPECKAASVDITVVRAIDPFYPIPDYCCACLAVRVAHDLLDENPKWEKDFSDTFKQDKHYKAACRQRAEITEQVLAALDHTTPRMVGWYRS